jgi:O-acetyl-ADP-ribose deacetylase
MKLFQAFPCIATGIYGFPNKKASKIAISSAREFLADNRDKVDRIIFCLFTKEDKKFYRDNMLVYFPIEEQNQEN